MREQKVLPKEFDFYFPHLDTMVLVQYQENGKVTIRMTKDNLSEKEKACFIRQLAAEGFIPDEYQWFSDSREDAGRVRWIKDYSWVKISTAVRQRSNRAMITMLIAAVVLWIAMMRVVIVSAPSNSSTQNSNPAAAVPQRTAGLEGNSDHSTLLRP